MPKKRKSGDVAGNPLLERTKLYIAKALEQTAQSIEKHLETGNEAMANQMGAYAAGLTAGMTLAELAAREMATKVTI